MRSRPARATVLDSVSIKERERGKKKDAESRSFPSPPRFGPQGCISVNGSIPAAKPGRQPVLLTESSLLCQPQLSVPCTLPACTLPAGEENGAFVFHQVKEKVERWDKLKQPSPLGQLRAVPARSSLTPLSPHGSLHSPLCFSHLSVSLPAHFLSLPTTPPLSVPCSPGSQIQFTQA